MAPYLQNTFVKMACLFIISLHSCTFAEAFQQVSQAGSFFSAGVGELVLECLFQLFYGDAIVFFGFWVGRESVGVVGGYFGVVDNLLWLSTTLLKVVRDGCGPLILAGAIHLSQDVCCTMVQIGAPGSRDPFVKAAHHQWVPEGIGDMDPTSFLAENTSVQGFLKQSEHALLLKIGRVIGLE